MPPETLFLVSAFLQRAVKFAELLPLLHAGPENQVVHQRPRFAIKQIDLLLILPEFAPGIFADQFVHLDQRSPLQAGDSRARSADEHLALFKAGVPVEVR